MEKTQLQLEGQDYLRENLETTKVIMEKQVMSFGRLLSGKIITRYPNINKESLVKLFLNSFTAPVCEEFDYLFRYYNKNETEFYDKNLKTADLVFNNKLSERNRIIYLNNVVKKINEREENYEEVFSTSAKNRYDEEDKEKHPSLNVIFSKFVQKLIVSTHLPVEQSQDLYDLAIHYYNLFQMDVASALSQFLSGNKQMAISKIEEEMDVRNLKDGTLTKEDRLAVQNSIDSMKKSLTDIVDKNKKEAKEELKECSSAMVDLIFRLLPAEYQEQKELLDIIVDTNINERLGTLLETEAEKLSDNLNSKNKDMLENELYEEKRYKNIPEHEQDLDVLDTVYQDVIHEICIAYDIPEDDQNAKRVKVVILSDEGNSPKSVFKKFENQVKLENRRELNSNIVKLYNQIKQKKNTAIQSENYGKK